MTTYYYLVSAIPAMLTMGRVCFAYAIPAMLTMLG